jgi:hypothetical protein
MRLKIIRRFYGRVLFALATLCAMSSLAGAAPDASMLGVSSNVAAFLRFLRIENC